MIYVVLYPYYDTVQIIGAYDNKEMAERVLNTMDWLTGLYIEEIKSNSLSISGMNYVFNHINKIKKTLNIKEEN